MHSYRHLSIIIIVIASAYVITTNDVTPRKLPTKISLSMICKIFIANGIIRVPLANCTCSTLRDHNITIEGLGDACKAIEKITNSSTVVQRNSTLATSYSSLAVLISLVGVVVNVLVITVSVRMRRRRLLNRFRELVLWLAICDTTYAVLQLIDAFPQFWTSRFVFGHALCKLLPTGLTLSRDLAIGHVILIAIERFCGLTGRKVNALLVRGLLLGNVILAVSAAIPLLVYFEVDDEIGTCRLAWPNELLRRDSKKYHSYQLVVYAILPLLVLCVLHIRVAAAIVTRQRPYRSERAGGRGEAVVPIAILLAFLVLVTPHIIALLVLDALGSHPDLGYLHGIPPALYYGLSYTRILYPLHTTLNPLLYSILDSDWRIHARALFCRPKLPTGNLNGEETSKQEPDAGKDKDRSSSLATIVSHFHPPKPRYLFYTDKQEQDESIEMD